jgi:hypothetical protein
MSPGPPDHPRPLSSTIAVVPARRDGALAGRPRRQRQAAEAELLLLPRSGGDAPLSCASRAAFVVLHSAAGGDVSGRGRAARRVEKGGAATILSLSEVGARDRPAGKGIWWLAPRWRGHWFGGRPSRLVYRRPSSRISGTVGLALDLALSSGEAGRCDPPLAEGVIWTGMKDGVPLLRFGGCRSDMGDRRPEPWSTLSRMGQWRWNALARHRKELRTQEQPVARRAGEAGRGRRASRSGRAASYEGDRNARDRVPSLLGGSRARRLKRQVWRCSPSGRSHAPGRRGEGCP